jgi:hypothetical protein
VNGLALASIAVILCGAVASPLLLAWVIYCLTRRARRVEGLSIFGVGVLAAGGLLIAGFLTAPPGSPGIFRFQALIIIAGAFSLGAAAGKALHLAASWSRRAGGRLNRAA